VKIKFLFAALCMLCLPMFFSTGPRVSSITPTPFAAVVFAGHTLSGGWCECGARSCICDPGEEGGAPIAQGGDVTTVSSKTTSSVDLGSSAMLIALALFVWSRMRA